MPSTSSGSSQSLFNLLVLIASMAGSLVAVFGGLLAFLEGQLNLRSVRGAPQVKGDVIRFHSERTEELERDSYQQKLEIQQQKLDFENKIDRLVKAISLLAQVAAPTKAGVQNDLQGELYRQLALMTVQTTPDSGSTSDIDAPLSAHAYAAPPHPHQTRPHEEISLPTRDWSSDEGWVVNRLSYADVASGGAESTSAVAEFTQLQVHGAASAALPKAKPLP
jgi:hypothetical protein